MKYKVDEDGIFPLTKNFVSIFTEQDKYPLILNKLKKNEDTEFVDMFERNDIVISDRIVVASTDHNIHAEEVSIAMHAEELELINMELSHEYI
jgi:hypothetical protein